MCCAHPHSLSSCLRLTEFRRSDFPPQCSLSAAPQWALWSWQRGQLYPLRKAFTNILCAGATGIKHRQPPGCPTFPFTLQHFKLLQAELPETVVNSWHWEFPWSLLACKKGCLFPSLKIMYFPGTVQIPQMRQMKDLFWPTSEKTEPCQTGPQDLVIIYTKCLCLKKLNSLP